MILNKIFRICKHKATAAIALLGALLLATGCSDELTAPRDISVNADGTFDPFDLVINVDMETGDAKTRGTFNSNDIDLESIWVAMFDATSGKMIAMDQRTDFHGGSLTTDGSETRYSKNIQLRSIRLNDANNKVFIAGVANFVGIKAKDANGNEMPLEEALNGILDIQDFRGIAINTLSAESVIKNKNIPVMTGFWGVNHGNFTISKDGKLRANSGYNSALEIELFDPVTKKITPNHKSNIEDKGRLHLRRLYSHINVNVNINPDKFIKFENPTLQVMQVPGYTFIAEHETLTNMDSYTNKDSWIKDTHAASDIYGPNLNTDKIGLGDYYEGNEIAGFVMNEGNTVRDGKPYDDALKMTRDSQDRPTGLTFGYWHYESKHWGLSSVKSQNDREKRHGSSNIFSSLCPSEGDAFNNNAPYMILRAYVETTDGYAGNAEFYFHEGYCCEPDGSQATNAANAARDFSTFRNCEYYYNIEINGINSILTKVNKEDFSGDYYAGAGGEFWGTRSLDVDVPLEGLVSRRVELPAGKFYWCVSEGSDSPFGIPMDDDYTNKEKYLSYPSNVTPDFDPASTSFYKLITIDGKSLAEVTEFEEQGFHTLSFQAQELEGFTGNLYLCGYSTSEDGTTVCYTVYRFNQDGDMLKTPELVMPNAPLTGEMVIGIDDHTVRWKEIEGADDYTISLVETGYTVTLSPGQTINQNGYNVTLKELDNNYLEFQLRFARSQNGMLALVNESGTLKADGTISVVANNNTDGKHSKPGTITRTFVNPYWDFNAKEWQDGVKKLTKDGNGFATNQELSVNGLTMYTGSSNKMTYELHSVYTFRPNGTGGTGNRGFRFKAAFKGKFNIWTSSTGSDYANDSKKTAERYANYSVRNATGGLVQSRIPNFVANASASGKQTKSGDVSVEAEYQGADNVYIYSDSDILFYKIQFTPQDR